MLFPDRPMSASGLTNGSVDQPMCHNDGIPPLSTNIPHGLGFVNTLPSIPVRFSQVSQCCSLLHFCNSKGLLAWGIFLRVNLRRMGDARAGLDGGWRQRVDTNVPRCYITFTIELRRTGRNDGDAKAPNAITQWSDRHRGRDLCGRHTFITPYHAGDYHMGPGLNGTKHQMVMRATLAP